MADDDVIIDDEKLFRSIRDGSDEYKIVDGYLRFSTTAFNDRNRRPSVDRGKFRDTPTESRKSHTDGVTLVIARDVRSIRAVQRVKEDKQVQRYDVDVVYAPEQNNASHSEVRCTPALDNDSTFRKLKEALARLAERNGWIVEPASWPPATGAPPAAAPPSSASP